MSKKISIITIVISLIAIVLHVPFYLGNLFYKSPIEITSVNATSWSPDPFVREHHFFSSLALTVRNNGESMEYLEPELFFVKDINGSLIGRAIGGKSKVISPHEEVTLNAEIDSSINVESFIIEVWTHDGDSASAYVEVSR